MAWHCLQQKPEVTGLSWSRKSTAEDEEAFSENWCTLRITPSLEGPWQVALEKLRIQQAFCDAVAAQEQSVTISIPTMYEPTVLMASHGFGELTGYRVEEILGSTYRFLNNDCMNNPEDLHRLRLALKREEPVTTIQINRRKSGDLFVNFLHIQGVSVARLKDSGETLRYLVGVQLDVTNFCDEGEPFHVVLLRMSQEIDSVAKSVIVQIAVAFRGFLRANAFRGKSYDVFELLRSHS